MSNERAIHEEYIVEYEETPSWANVDRIGIVTNTEEDTGWKDMLWLLDLKPICCDGQGMVAFELVMEE